MIVKKILFSVIISVVIIQSIYSADSTQTPIDKVFTLLNNPSELTLYLKNNPDAIHAISKDNQSLLEIVVLENQNHEIVQILLDMGANPNEILERRYFEHPFFTTSSTLLNALGRQYFNCTHLRRKGRSLLRSKKTTQHQIAELAALLIEYGAHTTEEMCMFNSVNTKFNSYIQEIIQSQQQKEKLAHAAFMTEKRPNTMLATELGQLLGHSYPSTSKKRSRS